MRRLFNIVLALMLAFTPDLLAQNNNDVAYSFDIEEVTIKYRPPLRVSEVGIKRTAIDTFALQESISISMADLLTMSSSIFIKSYGRATVSTASIRGTSSSHTLVTWNDMKINSPMLGMTDFSLIPSWFVDDVGIYRGAGSVNVAGGGLGGAIVLSTQPEEQEGFNVQYVQGLSSYDTYDQFLKIAYGNARINGSTRVYYVTSANDFTYTNYRKKVFVTDDSGDIIDSYHPTEKNRNGAFKDFHLLQELSFRGKNGGEWHGSLWYLNSSRGVPMLNVDYRDENNSRNNQDENSLRTVLSWDKTIGDAGINVKMGYSYTDLQYTYLGDTGNENLEEMVNSQSYVNTMFAKGKVEYQISDKWFVSGDLSLYQHFVESVDNALDNAIKEKTIIGYNKARLEVSSGVTVKYTPFTRLGLSLDLREDVYGDEMTPPIPALFAEYLLSYPGNVKITTSMARNYRYPTLNDLYFMPGGNDSLKTEKGFTYDAGIKFGVNHERVILEGEATVFDSYINDWILWLPTFKGFWSPVNVKKVHSYGLETLCKVQFPLGEEKRLVLDGNFSITRSKNMDNRYGLQDESYNMQLVYIPVYSSSVTGRFEWENWSFNYKWNYYSERFTTTSNDRSSITGVLSPYFMSDISLGRNFHPKFVDISLKLQVNNLFNEEYESVLSRPMARRNFGFFVGLVPRFSKRDSGN